ncbi:hypothetical protein LDENG_00075180, partial [Lucifuga dentata]
EAAQCPASYLTQERYVTTVSSALCLPTRTKTRVPPSPNTCRSPTAASRKCVCMASAWRTGTSRMPSSLLPPL